MFSTLLRKSSYAVGSPAIRATTASLLLRSCGSCSAPRVPHNMNCFKVLNVDVAYRIDMDKLNAEFKRLQKLVHPDKQFAQRGKESEAGAAAAGAATAATTGVSECGGASNKGPAIKGSIDDYIKSNLESTTVNHAYQTLRNPVERVKHIMIVLGLGEDLYNDPAINAEAFELREEIEEARQDGDLADAAELRKEIESRLRDEEEALQKCLDARDHAGFRRSASRFIFLYKALEEVSLQTENFEHMP